MRAAIIASIAALATTSLAAPWQGWHGEGNKGRGGRPGGGPPGNWGPPINDDGGSDNGQAAQCLTKEEGEEAADVFRALIQEYSDELALEYLTEDFVDWSSSVNGIINGGGDTPKALDQPTFATRQEFMDGQGSQPQIPFEKIFVLVGCDFVTMRWSTSDSAAGQETKVSELPVLGNVIITTVPNTEGGEHAFRIKEIYSEFTNAAWLVNLGVFKPKAEDIDTEAKRDVKSLRGNMI